MYRGRVMPSALSLFVIYYRQSMGYRYPALKRVHGCGMICIPQECRQATAHDTAIAMIIHNQEGNHIDYIQAERGSHWTIWCMEDVFQIRLR